MKDNLLFTVTQAAEYAEVNPSTIRYAIKGGRLKAEKHGGFYLIRFKELQRWLDDPAAHKTGRKAK